MMMKNPYHQNGKWYFYDESGDEYGPYPTEQRAEKELAAYCHWLNHGPTLWQKIWWPIRYCKLWHKQ